MSRYNKKRTGKRFTLGLIVGVIVTIIVYSVLHLIIDSKTHIPSPEELVRMDPDGQIVIKDFDRLNWYIPSTTTERVLGEAGERYSRIQELTSEVQRHLDKILETYQLQAYGERKKGTGSATVEDDLESIRKKLEAGDYEGARQDWPNARRCITKSTWEKMETGVGDSITEALSNLTKEKRQQEELIKQLRPPSAVGMFWTTPTLSVIEVFFWALFGVFTNLLLKSVEFLRKGTFKPLETWVAYAKLTYGPVLAVVLSLAIMVGWIDLGGYEVRVWTLPLVGFVFGFATRRTAQLVDRLVGAVMVRAEQSIDQGPEAIREKHRAFYQRLLTSLRPRNWQELREQAKDVARATIEADVIDKEEDL